MHEHCSPPRHDTATHVPQLFSNQNANSVETTFGRLHMPLQTRLQQHHGQPPLQAGPHDRHGERLLPLLKQHHGQPPLQTGPHDPHGEDSTKRHTYLAPSSTSFVYGVPYEHTCPFRRPFQICTVTGTGHVTECSTKRISPPQVSSIFLKVDTLRSPPCQRGRTALARCADSMWT